MTRPRLIAKREARKERQKKRAYAKQKAREEFDHLLSAWNESKSEDNWKRLEEFSKKGNYQKKFFDGKFNKAKKIRKKKGPKNKSRNPFESCIAKMSSVTNFKPYQGGAPGLGKKS